MAPPEEDLFGDDNEEYADTELGSPYKLRTFLELQRQHIRVSEAREKVPKVQTYHTVY